VLGSDSALLAIFDHDGVLVDSLPFHMESWFEMGRREGLDISPEFIRSTFGMTNPMILRRLLGDDLDADRIARYADIKEACYRDIARGRIELMPGVRELLDNLTNAGVKLAIGSSGPRLNLELTVTSCGLDGRFATIVSVEEIRHGKPDPEVFLKAAGRVGLAPSCAVVFEDAPVGVQAARAAGMYAVGVGTTHDLDALRRAGADEVVTDLVGYPVERLLRRLTERVA
jgi:HAD superfamily hydrolase (TIGR01509 family)